MFMIIPSYFCDKKKNPNAYSIFTKTFNLINKTKLGKISNYAHSAWWKVQIYKHPSSQQYYNNQVAYIATIIFAT